MTVEFVSITEQQRPHLHGVMLNVSIESRATTEPKSFPFFEIIELQNKLTSVRLKEIKDKLKFANLATAMKDHSVAPGPTTVQQSTSSNTGFGYHSIGGLGGLVGNTPSVPPIIAKDKLNLTLSILTESPYVIIEDCIIPQSNAAFGYTLPYDMLVGEPSSTHSSMKVKMGINFGEVNSQFASTPVQQVTILSEVMKNYKIAPMISFDGSTPSCRYKIYIYIKKLDALIATKNSSDLYCEDTVHPMGFILLSLMFILMDEVWTDEDIMKIKPYVEECGW
jgi:hypothetical protein